MQIHEAAAKGDIATVKGLLDQTPDLVNQDDQFAWRAVFHASLHRQYDIVKLLIDRGADLSVHDGYVMHFAGEVDGNKRIVELLVQYGALDAHTEPKSQTARQFIAAVFLANEDRVSALLRSTPNLAHEIYARGDTALHHASRNGDLGVVKILIDADADVNAMSMTSQFPLYCAAGHGHVDTVDYLLRQGADVQLQLAEGKTVAQWLRQYAVDNIRYQKCLELVTR